jgi:hypothetical protein
MTYSILANYLAEIVQIAQTDSTAAIQAQKILQSEVTEYNTNEIKTLIESYDRNR